MTDKQETAERYRYKSGHTGSALEKEDLRMLAGFFSAQDSSLNSNRKGSLFLDPCCSAKSFPDVCILLKCGVK